MLDDTTGNMVIGFGAKQQMTGWVGYRPSSYVDPMRFHQTSHDLTDGWMSEDPKSVRVQTRKKKVVDLSKHLVTANERSPIRCLAVDISCNGIGLVSFDALTPEIELILPLQGKEISLMVKWSKPDSVRNGVYHAGLETNDPSTNLLLVFEEAGLIETTESKAAESPALPTPEKEVPPITFASLRDLLATARTTDNNMLRRGKLARLADTYDAYPVNYEGTSLFVLLPKGVKPAEASKLEEPEAAAKKIFVLTMGQGNLRVIWPTGFAADGPTGAA